MKNLFKKTLRILFENSPKSLENLESLENLKRIYFRDYSYCLELTSNGPQRDNIQLRFGENDYLEPKYGVLLEVFPPSQPLPIQQKSTLEEGEANNLLIQLDDGRLFFTQNRLIDLI